MKHYRPLMPFQKETLETAEINVAAAEEGTLYLSITTPDLNSAKPVMVWLWAKTLELLYVDYAAHKREYIVRC